MRDPSDITALQAEILEVIWERGQATAAEVREHIGGDAELARTTVATMLGRMEKYGWLNRSRDGREFHYAAALTRGQVRGSQMRRMIGSLYPNDLPSLVSHALREGDWNEDDLERIEGLVRSYRAGAGEDGE